MPIKPKSICKHPLCPHLATPGQNGLCSIHFKSYQCQSDAHRGTAHDRGYTNRWHRARTSYLTSHPLCAECLKTGRPVPATVVDHIIPHKGNQALFWDESNWQALCKSCHDTKTAKEDGGFRHESKRLAVLARFNTA